MRYISRLIYSRGVKRSLTSFTTYNASLETRRAPKGWDEFYPSVAVAPSGVSVKQHYAAGVN